MLAASIANWITRLAFAPRKCLNPSKEIRTHPRKDGSGMVEYIFFEIPESKYLLVLFHGQQRTLDSQSVKRWKKFARERRFSLLMHNYPGYGNTPGPASCERIGEDATEIVEMLGQRGNNQRIMILGNSIGCGPALCFASRASVTVEKVALISPYVSLWPLVFSVVVSWPLRRFTYLLKSTRKTIANFLGSPSRLKFLQGSGADPFRSVETVSTTGISELMLVHGEDDEIIPISHSEALYSAAKKNASLTTTIIRIPDCGHQETRSKAQMAIDSFFSGDAEFLSHEIADLEDGRVFARDADGPD